MRPLWMLDVDGTLFPYSYGPSPAWADAPRVSVPFQRRIPISPTLVRRVVQLADRVDIVWMTNRGRGVLPLAQDLGFPRFPVAASRTKAEIAQYKAFMALPFAVRGGVVEDHVMWWKLPHVAGIAGGRPLVWTDDELFDHPESDAWAGNRPATLAIAPFSSVGLTPADLDAIEAFV